MNSDAWNEIMLHKCKHFISKFKHNAYAEHNWKFAIICCALFDYWMDIQTIFTQCYDIYRRPTLTAHTVGGVFSLLYLSNLKTTDFRLFHSFGARYSISLAYGADGGGTGVRDGVQQKFILFVTIFDLIQNETIFENSRSFSYCSEFITIQRFATLRHSSSNFEFELYHCFFFFFLISLLSLQIVHNIRASTGFECVVHGIIDVLKTFENINIVSKTIQKTNSAHCGLALALVVSMIFFFSSYNRTNIIPLFHSFHFILFRFNSFEMLQAKIFFFLFCFISIHDFNIISILFDFDSKVRIVRVVETSADQFF